MAKKNWSLRVTTARGDDLVRMGKAAQDRKTDEDKMGANLAAARKAEGISQAELAQRMSDQGHDWHQNTVSRIERGRQPMTMGELRALRQMGFSDILNGTDLAAEMDHFMREFASSWLLARVERAEKALAAASMEIAMIRDFIESNGEHGEVEYAGERERPEGPDAANRDPDGWNVIQHYEDASGQRRTRRVRYPPGPKESPSFPLLAEEEGDRGDDRG